MRNVLLFNSTTISRGADIVDIGDSYPRVGVASIASYLQQHGIKVNIIDPHAEKLGLKEIKDKVMKIRPDIVGLSAYTEEICDAAEIAKTIKEATPHTVTVVGGPHVSAIPTQTLHEFPYFDVGVIGEGEQTLTELAEEQPLKKINGIAYRDGARVTVNASRPLIEDLDAIPTPAWHLYDLALYRGVTSSSVYQRKGEKLELPILSLRGCPYGCIFCFRTIGRRVRYRSPNKVVDEIQLDIEKFEADTIQFVGGTFPVKREHAIAICNEIIQRRLDIVWTASTRVDNVDRALLVKMRRAGCRFIDFGVESGDPETLEIIGKGITLKQIMKAFRLCKEVGIKAYANFIIGHPFETEEKVMRTIALAKKLAPYTSHASFAILVPFPGTRIHQMALNNVGGLNLKTADWKMYGKQAGTSLELKQLPSEKLTHLQTLAYKSYYLTPQRIGSLLRLLTRRRIVFSLKRLLKI